MTSLSRSKSTLALASLLAAALTGCGGKDDASSTATPKAGATATVQPGAVVAAEPKASSSKSKVDAAFVREMLPHHELAVEMAKLAPGRASHVEVKFLAARIVTSQSSEIKTLEAAAKRLGVKLDDTTAGMGGMSGMNSHAKQDAQDLGLSPSSLGMSMSVRRLKTAKPFDKAFLAAMIPHHAGAIVMARAEVASGGDPALKKLATSVLAVQASEVVQMSRWRMEWYRGK